MSPILPVDDEPTGPHEAYTIPYIGITDAVVVRCRGCPLNVSEPTQQQADARAAEHDRTGE